MYTIGNTKGVLIRVKNVLINKMIPEEVLGWKKEERPNGTDSPYTAWYWVKDDEIQKPANFFSPSYNLDDAWLVLEMMNLTKKEIKWVDEAKQWNCTLGKDTGEMWSAYSDTIQQAICLAALKRVNVDFSGVEE